MTDNSSVVDTMPCKNIGTNDKCCRKVALLKYIRKGLNLGFKAGIQFQNKNHTEV